MKYIYFNGALGTTARVYRQSYKTVWYFNKTAGVWGMAHGPHKAQEPLLPDSAVLLIGAPLD